MTPSILLVASAAALLLAGQVGRRAEALRQRRATVRALRRLRALVDDVGGLDDHDRLHAVVAAALVDVLSLERCWFEAHPGADLPRLEADGEVTALVQHRVADGLVLPETVAIRAGTGCYLLVGRPGHGTSLEERIVASAMVAASTAWVREPH